MEGGKERKGRRERGREKKRGRVGKGRENM